MSTDTATVEKTETEVQMPHNYKVVFHNDDYTPMDFVMEVLTQIYHKTASEAYEIMMHVHHYQRGVAGIYPKDIAQQKQQETHQVARQEGHPLKVTVEKE